MISGIDIEYVNEIRYVGFNISSINEDDNVAILYRVNILEQICYQVFPRVLMM